MLMAERQRSRSAFSGWSEGQTKELPSRAGQGSDRGPYRQSAAANEAVDVIVQVSYKRSRE